MTRYTIHCDPSDLILASRAARYGSDEMPGKDAILVYGEDVATFYVKRTRGAGISVRRIADQAPDKET